MKLKFLLLLIPVLWSCKQDLADKKPEKAVQEFINGLKKGGYKDFRLPEFDSRHIPELLKYGDDYTIITQFPRNSISSAWVPEVYLGTYVLWTIESIRVRTANDRFISPGGFPSLNPYLWKKTTERGPMILSKEAQKIALEAYRTWWTQGGPFSHNPLAETDYEW